MQRRMQAAIDAALLVVSWQLLGSFLARFLGKG
jgi:hypothetical protein